MHTELQTKSLYIKDSWSLAEKKEALKGMFDEDDNGGNGEEYLIDGAKSLGYWSNADFFIAKNTKGEKINVEEVLRASVRDDGYYLESSVSSFAVPDGSVYFIAYVVRR